MLDFEVTANNERVSLEIRVFAERLNNDVRSLSEVLGEFAESRLRELAPHGATGFLRNSVHRIPVHRDRAESAPFANVYITEVRVGAPYAMAVDRGSGRYGPKHQDIIAPAGNVFRLLKDPNADRRGKAGVVFTKSVKGQKPQYFIERAVAETNLFARAATNMTIGTEFRGE